MNILYIVHDLNDAAVKRRVAMLEVGGAQVTVVGFYRGTAAFDINENVISLGQTHDASFIHRIKSVVKEKLTLQRRFREHHITHDRFDLIVARNLDMLALAVSAKKILHLPLVYECLDIHRFLIHSGVIGHVFRQLEKRLSQHAGLLITSSQGFVEHYFNPLSLAELPTLVLENKVFSSKPLAAPTPKSLNDGPIIITWNGAIRCHRSLDILIQVSRKMAGKVQVVIHGKPAYTEFDDFISTIANEPYIEFQGPYVFPDDLADIYNSAHFNWTLDFFEQGGNSEWLLPNRIYEGGLFALPPLYRAGNYTAQTLNNLQIGFALEGKTNQEIANHLVTMLQGIDETQYQSLVAASKQVPTSRWLFDTTQAEWLVSSLQMFCQQPDSLSLSEQAQC
ncbi:hypothetical protein [Vibrio agarivorans]|uniref:hypothetical protein n=1 Tax=Vibrio agarivorans TaxID=153622 RepID=UPI0025B4107B|nr:hypothetical protein [Vibrio agarivorans]MDN3660801.1 hypothetical protein [Vibrio agarivorans]